jgi:hypothetical protein
LNKIGGSIILSLESNKFVGGQKILLVISLLFTTIFFTHITSAQQNVSPDVEIECEQNQLIVDAKPGYVTDESFVCTVTNPSIHPETINVFASSEETIEYQINPSSFDLGAEESKDVTVTFTPMTRMWADDYILNVTAEVTEVYGSTPPSSSYAHDDVEYTVAKYTEFEFIWCVAEAPGYNKPVSVYLYCELNSLSNFYDKYTIYVADESKSSLEKYGYTFNEAEFGQGITEAEGSDGSLFFNLDDLFTISNITSEWEKGADYDDYTVLTFESEIIVEVESHYSKEIDSPHIETNNIPLDPIYAFYEGQQPEEYEDISDKGDDLLPSIGIIHTIFIINLAVIVVAYRKKEL